MKEAAQVHLCLHLSNRTLFEITCQGSIISTSLTMSTSVLKALSGKHDIKRCEPGNLFLLVLDLHG